MAILVIMAGAVMPSLGGVVRANRLSAGARAVLAQVRFARELAISHNTYARLEIDPDAGVSRVLELNTDDPDAEPTWEENRQAAGVARRLPDGLRFIRTVAATEEGARTLTFAPNGSATDWFLVIGDERDYRLALRVLGTLGTTRIIEPGRAETYADLVQAEERRS